MRLRRLKATSILSDADVRLLTAGVTELLPTGLPNHLLSRVTIEAGIRFRALAAKCRDGREQRRLTVRDVATQLKVPQFRLRAIEDAHLSEVRSDVLGIYVDFLEFRSWFMKWRRANRSLARELGLEIRPRGQSPRARRRAV